MIRLRNIGSLSVALGLSFIIGGAASASDIDTAVTGADSIQNVSINDVSEVMQSNTSVISTNSSNFQTATTGNTSADSNTVVGGLQSGNASNDNGSTTAVTVKEPVGGFGGNVPVPQAPAAVPVQTGGQGGSVLGAATVSATSAASLPAVGASIPVDVSALRSAWESAQTQRPVVAGTQTTTGWSPLALVLATLLGFMGALGSSIHLRRQTVRV